MVPSAAFSLTTVLLLTLTTGSPAPAANTGSDVKIKTMTKAQTALVLRKNIVPPYSGAYMPCRAVTDTRVQFALTAPKTQRGRALTEPAPSQPHIFKFILRGLLRRS